MCATESDREKMREKVVMRERERERDRERESQGERERESRVYKGIFDMHRGMT